MKRFNRIATALLFVGAAIYPFACAAQSQPVKISGAELDTIAYGYCQCITDMLEPLYKQCEAEGRNVHGSAFETLKTVRNVVNWADKLFEFPYNPFQHLDPGPRERSNTDPIALIHPYSAAVKWDELLERRRKKSILRKDYRSACEGLKRVQARLTSDMQALMSLSEDANARLQGSVKLFAVCSFSLPGGTQCIRRPGIGAVPADMKQGAACREDQVSVLARKPTADSFLAVLSVVYDETSSRLSIRRYPLKEMTYGKPYKLWLREEAASSTPVAVAFQPDSATTLYLNPASPTARSYRLDKPSFVASIGGMDLGKIGSVTLCPTAH